MSEDYPVTDQGVPGDAGLAMLWAGIRKAEDAPKKPKLPWKYATVEVGIPAAWALAEVDYEGKSAVVSIRGGKLVARIRRLVCGNCGVTVSRYQFERASPCRSCGKEPGA